MPCSCSVPNCHGNYKKGPKVNVFSFPKDKELAKTWLRLIKRDDFTTTKFSKVCELHFRPEDIKRETSAFDEKTGTTITVRLQKPYLQNGAIPRILPNCPSYLSTSTTFRESPNSKKIRLENSALKSALNQSIADDLAYKQQKTFHSIDDLEDKLNFLDRNYWSVVRQQDTLIICHIIKTPCPKISLSLVIKSDFAVHVFCNDVEMDTIGEYKIPNHVTDENTLQILMENMKNMDIEEQQTKPQNVISILKLILSFLLLVQDESFKHFNAIKFIYEQMNLMTLNKFNYSTEMMIFSSLFYNCSPRGYRLLRDTKNVLLPSYSTIRRITLSTYMNPVVEQHDNNFLMYIKNKFKLLVQKDITVSLLVDEIHLKPYFDYKGGNVVGLANNSNEAATSAFAFMLSSVFSNYKDVVHVMPTKCLKAENLFDIVKRLIIGLEEIGFRVLSVITDNNAINKKAMSFFCSPAKLSIVYPHPVMESRPLFFLFDSVHILKCIRNNWLGQKDAIKCMMFPKFCHNGNHELDSIQSAPFSTLHKLHALESQSLLKYCYKLTSKALSPTNLERQNVNLVLQIFNEYTIQGLLTLGKQKCLPNFAEVAEYINIFYIWWTILNVKTPYKGCRLRNKYANPLKLNEENYRFLSIFCDWLESWNSIPGRTGKLTKETYTALHHTTYAILELTKYCIKEMNMAYILPGKFQTDHLEARFGQYRQLSGDQYNISIRQVFECEKKLRMLSVLKLSLPLNNRTIDLKNLQEANWDEMTREQQLDVHKFNIDVTDDDVNQCKEVLPVILYLAGYCCFAVFKKMKCNSCKNLLSGRDDVEEIPEINCYFQGINRGSLLYPNDMTTNFVLYNYVVTGKLVKHSSFLHSVHQRQLAMHITLNVLADANLLFHVDSCDEGHSIEKIERMLVWSSTNSLLNNFCGKENDNITKNKLSRKRKFQTFN